MWREDQCLWDVLFVSRKNEKGKGLKRVSDTF